MPWNFYNASGELQINDGGVQAGSAVFTGNVDLGSNLLVGNGGTTGIAISANGEVTMAKQPCFHGNLEASVADQTGNGGNPTITFSGTDLFDLNGDFASNTFTAPVEGHYLLIARIYWDGRTSASHQYAMTINTTDHDYQNQWDLTTGTSGFQIQDSVVAYLDASDTAYLQGAIYGESSNQVDLYASGTTNIYTSFSGCLLA